MSEPDGVYKPLDVGRPGVAALCTRRRIVMAAATAVTVVVVTSCVLLIGGPIPGGVPPASNGVYPLGRVCSVFCEGPLLAAVQNAGIFPDQKTFVDMVRRCVLGTTAWGDQTQHAM